MSKDIASMLGEKKEEPREIKTNGVGIAMLILKARTDTHITHLKQKNKILATHKALETFYTDIVDLVDTFIETSMGIDDSFSLEEVGESSIIENPIEYFKTLYSTIEKERTSIKESFRQNQIDELQQLIARTLYRLKYITS